MSGNRGWRDIHGIEDDTGGKRADAVSGGNDDVTCVHARMSGTTAQEKRNCVPRT